MQVVDKGEIPQRTLTYTLPSGERTTGVFPEDKIERCKLCGRNQPETHMTTHMAWEHG